MAKLFLIADDDDPAYSLYYIWQTPSAMWAFLEAERFAAVTAKYGRPNVTPYLTLDSGIALGAGDRLDLEDEPIRGRDVANSFHDPVTGQDIRLVRSTRGRHEVLFVARNQDVRSQDEREEIAGFSRRLGELL